MLEALAILQNVWAALSLVSAVAGVAGLALLAAAILVLPSAFKRAAVALALALVFASTLYQVAHMAGAEKARVLAEKRATEAELERLKRSSEINRRDADRAARAIAAAQADNTKLKGLLDDALKDRDAGRVCVDHGTSRRLRNL